MDRLIKVLTLLALLLAGPALAQQAGTVTNMPPASTPLNGAEFLYIIQGGVSKKINVGTFSAQVATSPLIGILYGNGTGNPITIAPSIGSGSILLATGAGAPVINVKNPAYAGGAKGDGTTDDGPAFNAAIAACPASGGCTVFVPDVCPSYYKIVTGVTLPGHVRLLGEANIDANVTNPMTCGSLLINAGSGAMITLPGSATVTAQTSVGQSWSHIGFDGANLNFPVISAPEQNPGRGSWSVAADHFMIAHGRPCLSAQNSWDWSISDYSMVGCGNMPSATTMSQQAAIYTYNSAQTYAGAATNSWRLTNGFIDTTHARALVSDSSGAGLANESFQVSNLHTGPQGYESLYGCFSGSSFDIFSEGAVTGHATLQLTPQLLTATLNATVTSGVTTSFAITSLTGVGSTPVTFGATTVPVVGDSVYDVTTGYVFVGTVSSYVGGVVTINAAASSGGSIGDALSINKGGCGGNSFANSVLTSASLYHIQDGDAVDNLSGITMYPQPTSGNAYVQITQFGYFNTLSNLKTEDGTCCDTVNVLSDPGAPSTGTSLMDSDGAETLVANNERPQKYAGVIYQGELSTAKGMTTYSPAVTCGTGTATTLGAVTGRYKQVANLIFVEVVIPITTNGSCAVYLQVSLPANPTQYAILAGQETQSTNTVDSAVVNAGSVYAFVRKYDGSYPGGTGTTVVFSGWYEDK